MNAPTIVLIAATGLVLVFSSIAMTETRIDRTLNERGASCLDTGFFADAEKPRGMRQGMFTACNFIVPFNLSPATLGESVSLSAASAAVNYRFARQTTHTDLAVASACPEQSPA